MVNYPDKATPNRSLHLMFNTVPPRYDLINHIITWGLDKRWRRDTARKCLAVQPRRLLDLCCGTADLAITIALMAENSMELIAIDYSHLMLDTAAAKAESLGVGNRISFIYGDAAKLPFPDGHFDCIGISFAFRNLTYKNPQANCHLAEAYRVLNTGGRFVIVETSQPKSRLIRRIFHIYLRWFVFRVGYILSGSREAYKYLAESAARFYMPQEVRQMLIETGFHQILYYPFFMGVAGVHIAVK
jgi:demethylmenaquinone methyltransferase/2-methoxy-6-polyprenyl-1,4-benzoquinol methylase